MKKFLLSLGAALMAVSAMNAESWKKVSTADDLTLDGKYLVVCESKNQAMGCNIGTSKFLPSVSATINNSEITSLPADVAVVTFEGTSFESVKLNISDANGTSKGYYTTTTAKSMSIGAGTAASVTVSGGNTTISFGTQAGVLYYNAASPRFLNYTSSQTAVQLYKKVAVGPVDYEPGFQDVELMAGDTHTLALGDKHPADMIFVSGNDNVATVTDEGVITAVAEGTATITCSWDADSNFNAGETEFTVTVTPKVKVVYAPDFQNVTITEGSTLALALGEKHPEILFESSDENVATIDNAGVITALAVGETTISCLWGDADYEDGEAEFTVTVENAPLEDTLTGDKFGVTTTYKNYSYTGEFADYTTFAYKGNGLQWNTKTQAKCGLIANGKEGYHVVSVKIGKWGTSKKLNIYASNDDYTSTEELSNTTAVNSITAGSTAEYVFEGQFKNFGIRPAETGACQVDDIVVVWAPDTPATQVATPAFNPGAGAVAAGSKVEITCTTEGAAIYYTVNGDEPTTASAVYTEPIEINEDMTIKAIAVKEGLDDSKVAEAAYTLLPHVNSIADIESNIGYPAIGASSSEFTVNCDLTVNFASGAYIYVTDGTNCSLIFAYNTTVAAGDVIGKGWNATIKNYNGLYEFIPANNADIKANGEVGTVTEPIDLTADNADEVLTVANQCKPVKTHLYIFDAAVNGSLTAYLDKAQTVSVICRNPMKVAGFDDLVDKNGEINGYLSVYTTASRAGESGVQLNISRIGEMTGVEGVEVDGDDAAVEYFNLQGVRVENPAAGGLYIRKQGSKVTKVIL